MKRKNKGWRKFAKPAVLFLILCFLIACVRNEKAEEKQVINEEELLVGQLNPELKEVMAFTTEIYDKSSNDVMAFVALLANGEKVVLEEKAYRFQYRYNLIFAYNRLFYLDEEGDCISCIDLSKGNGNYKSEVLIDNLAFDRVTSMAVANGCLFYVYRDEFVGKMMVKRYDLQKKKHQETLYETTERFQDSYWDNEARVDVWGFDEQHIVLAKDNSIYLIDTTDGSEELVFGKEAALIRVNSGSLLYTVHKVDDYDEDEDEADIKIDLYEYQQAKTKKIPGVKLGFFDEYEEDEALIIPYQHGYVFSNKKKIYIYDGKKIEAIYSISNKDEYEIVEMFFVSADIVRITVESEGCACSADEGASYEVNLKSGKAKKVKGGTPVGIIYVR